MSQRASTRARTDEAMGLEQGHRIPAMGAIAKLDARESSVEPGSQSTLGITVRNKGTVVDQLTLEVLGTPAAWSSVDPPSVSLLPDADASPTIVFRPPRSSSIPAGPMPFGIRVASQEDPAGSVVEEGVLHIAPFSDAAAELMPRTSRGSRGARHELAVDNRGNTQLNATLTGTDPDQNVSLRITPPAVVVDAGHAVLARVAVRARRRFWRGQPKTRAFRVQVESPDQAPIWVDGALLQEPIIPGWLPKALGVLAIAIVAAVAGWILLLQPAVETAANDVVNRRFGTPPPGPVSPTPAPVTAQGSTDASGSSDDGASAGGEPTPPIATPTPSPGSTPSPEVTSTPVDGRLLVGGERMADAGTSIYITDLVFSNPNAGSGELRFLRDDEELLVLQLDNFRDLDFHFVTPIVFGADQPLRLDCLGTCDGAALYYSGYAR